MWVEGRTPANASEGSPRRQRLASLAQPRPPQGAVGRHCQAVAWLNHLPRALGEPGNIIKLVKRSSASAYVMCWSTPLMLQKEPPYYFESVL